jgi:hypothetical protein
MMVAVAVVTVLLYACVLTARLARYLTLARQYQAEVVMYLELERISLEKLDESKGVWKDLFYQGSE